MIDHRMNKQSYSVSAHCSHVWRFIEKPYISYHYAKKTTIGSSVYEQKLRKSCSIREFVCAKYKNCENLNIAITYSNAYSSMFHRSIQSVEFKTKFQAFLCSSITSPFFSSAFSRKFEKNIEMRIFFVVIFLIIVSMNIL